MLVHRRVGHPHGAQLVNERPEKDELPRSAGVGVGSFEGLVSTVTYRRKRSRTVLAMPFMMPQPVRYTRRP
ncbi:MAG: hypothetical protein R2712_14050 [Vicinamibacterales bacterium]